MPLSVIVLIREDPHKTHRAVEALRIALGLSTGDFTLAVALLGKAPSLLAKDIEDIVDAEILEKHIPVLKELEIPFLVPEGTHTAFDLDPDFVVRDISISELSHTLRSADRVLAF